jgi:hypothetical protein
MTEKLIGGMTGKELAEVVGKCMVAFAEHVAKTGIDPVAEIRTKYAAEKRERKLVFHGDIAKRRFTFRKRTGEKK